MVGIILLGGCATPKPTPSPTATPVPPLPEPSRLTPGTSASIGKGLLAGQVIDSFNREVPKASIQLVEVRDGGPTGAPLEVWANQQGFFTIPGLDTRQTYQLTARVAEGSKVVMAATVFARPPDPRLLIKVSGDYVTPNIPAPPTLPSVVVPPPVKAKERSRSRSRPHRLECRSRPSRKSRPLRATTAARLRFPRQVRCGCRVPI
jgi:hypothetical protein